MGERGVYPRGCGEAPYASGKDITAWGLSPRVRGSRGSDVGPITSIGSIPAGAGKPRAGASIWDFGRVYPRGCGEALSVWISSLNTRGLSPRVRGSHERARPYGISDGSIPAGAGKPRPAGRSSSWCRVYPRGCGEASAAAPRSSVIPGLSPRVRGSRRVLGRGELVFGSIPAGAGKPSPPRRSSNSSRVYPRGCGEASIASQSSIRIRGLSPRVRGSLGAAHSEQLPNGSIPAGAGKPPCRQTTALEFGVYPRGCGEADGKSKPRTMVDGVYPRGCGEAAARRGHAVSEKGLSPRVRGSRARPARQDHR